MVCILKEKKIYPAYVSKHNSNHERHVILLMILDGERWHYIAVKQLTALLREITWKHHDDFCFWIVFILLEKNNNLNHIKKYVKKNIFAILQCLLKTLKY